VLVKWIVEEIEGDEEFDELQRQPRIGKVSHNHIIAWSQVVMVVVVYKQLQEEKKEK
jgi:hypothetical protein